MTSLRDSLFPVRQIAWGSAKIIPGYDQAQWRWDDYGSVMKWSEYGNRDSEFGWEIDHRVPSAAGGSDAFSNLRALNWRNNASLGGLLAAALSNK
jgi:5-methylcytosine-specific restriction endonuclease McrA